MYYELDTGVTGGLMKTNTSRIFKIMYGISSYTSGLLLGSIGSYLMFYYTDIALIPFTLVGSLFFFGKILNAFFAFLTGIMIDKTESRFGKIKPYLFVSSISLTIFTIMIFLTPYVDDGIKLIYVSLVYILWGLSSVVYNTAYASVFPTLTRDSEERNKLSIIPMIGNVLGDFTSVGAFFPLLGIIAINQTSGFLRLFVIFSLLFIFFTLIFIKIYQESEPVEKMEITSLKDMLIAIAHNDQLLVILITSFLSNMGVWITTSTALYFFKYNLNNEDMFATFGILVGLSQVLMMSQFPKLMKKVKKKTAYIISSSLIISGYILMFITRNIAKEYLMFVYLGGVLLYFGLGISNSIMPIFLADVIDYGEWKNKNRNNSTIVSINSLVGTFSDALVGLIVTLVLSKINFIPNVVQSSETLNGIAFLLTAIPLILVALALVVFIFFYKLNNEVYDEILNDLEKGDRKSI